MGDLNGDRPFPIAHSFLGCVILGFSGVPLLGPLMNGELGGLVGFAFLSDALGQGDRAVQVARLILFHGDRQQLGAVDIGCDLRSVALGEMVSGAGIRTTGDGQFFVNPALHGAVDFEPPGIFICNGQKGAVGQAGDPIIVGDHGARPDIERWVGVGNDGLASKGGIGGGAAADKAQGGDAGIDATGDGNGQRKTAENP